MTDVSCFVFEQSIMLHKAALQNVYNVLYFKTSSVCIFNVIKKKSGIRFIVDALFANFAYLHSLYTVVKLYTNFVSIHFESLPIYYNIGVQYQQHCSSLCLTDIFILERQNRAHDTGLVIRVEI